MTEGITFTGDFVGKVLDRDTTTGKLAVYIPKLMPNLDSSQLRDSFIKTIQSSNTLYDSKYYKNIKTQNYIWVLPSNKDLPIPLIGSKVLIRFIDYNPNLGIWEPLNINSNIYKLEEITESGITDRIESLELITHNKSVLPRDTKIGDIKYSEIESLKNIKVNISETIDTIKKELERSKKLIMKNINIQVNDWVEDKTHHEYGFKAIIMFPTITSEHEIDILFNPSEDVNNFYPYYLSDINTVTIYCKVKPLQDVNIIYVKGEYYDNKSI